MAAGGVSVSRLSSPLSRTPSTVASRARDLSHDGVALHGIHPSFDYPLPK